MRANVLDSQSRDQASVAVGRVGDTCCRFTRIVV